MSFMFITDTDIAPIVDVSTYGGPFSYDSLWSADEESERAEGRLVCDDFDPKLMGRRIVAEANNVFHNDRPLSDFGVLAITATKFGSPREYNFRTDWLDIVVEVEESFFDKALVAITNPENRAAVVAHSKAHWVSRDGFTSFMLDRTRDLSIDVWRHNHCGTPIATDDEIAQATIADLRDIIERLRSGEDGDDEREFGALLGLIWRIRYPEDFDGSHDNMWVTEEMLDHLRGNSSLSEFCTVLEPDEIRKRFGGHMYDFAGLSARLTSDSGKYRAQQASNPAFRMDVLDRFTDKAWKYIAGKRDEELAVISNNIGKGDEAVNALLDAFKSELDASIDADLDKLWGTKADDDV